MFGGRELKGLELRRRELVLQSTLHRLTLKVELQQLEAALGPAERIVSSVRALRPWLLLLAPLAGIFAARRFRGNGSGFSKIMAVLKLIQPLLALWKQFMSSTQAEAGADTPPASPASGSQD